MIKFSLLVLVLATNVLAISYADVYEDAKLALQTARDRYPATDVRSAIPSSLPGIFEFDMGGESVYGDMSARHLILGRMIDMEEFSQPTIEYAKFAESAFVLQEGDLGELILFSDPNCPYCATLERRLLEGELTGYRIKVILIEVTGDSGLTVEHILCAKNPGSAYRSYVLERFEPEPCLGERSIIHNQLAIQAKVKATPSFLVPKGYVLAGLPEEQELLSWVKEGQL